MPNRLAHESSPYLLQHAGNPVQWHPWDRQALDLAEQQDRPILLSIGYSACHWCHVMERECFEDADIAKVMNELFVCIKVDREERPDLDRIYQLSHQILMQRPGGWPLTVALTPRGHAPFFAGTYFPPEPRFQLPGFADVLRQVCGHYRENRDKFDGYVVSFSQALSKLNPAVPGASPTDPDVLLKSAVSTLQKQYDRTFGGFGDAPKFPHPTQLELLLLGTARLPQDDSRHCREMALASLRHMAQGGLFDQLGGGFFRYSVDREWKIPHFEKMLYDNAQLLCLYCDAWTLTRENLYQGIAAETCNWVQAEMQDRTGGYTATLDADSDGEEGRFYVWSETDLRGILSEPHYEAIEEHFALYGEPNFEGKWHFNVNPQRDSVISQDPRHLRAIQEARATLLQVRSTRNRPNMDTKILAAWNGLMIKGMARAGRILDAPACIRSARRAIDCIRNNLWTGHRLKACLAGNRAQLNGYLDDYAFMLEGLLEMLQTEWSTDDAAFATGICDAMLDLFEDPELGGFHFTSHDHEALLCRIKSGADDAIPSGNASAIRSLIMLGTLLGNSRYLQSADRALGLFSPETARQPSVNALMTIASDQAARGALVIVRAAARDMDSWKQAMNSRYRPSDSMYCIGRDLKNLPGALAQKNPGTSGIAYVCRGMQCSPPANSIQDLLQELDG